MRRLSSILSTVFLASLGVAAAEDEPKFLTDANRDVYITGSSTVAPYAAAVGHMVHEEAFVTVDATGTSAGIAVMCSEGADSVDIAAASRPIRESELTSCHEAGISSLAEITIGYDAVIFARGEKSAALPLTARDVYLAVARRVPRGDYDCVMEFNRRVRWNEVRSDLPSEQITVIGPPITSGTREMLIELVLKEGARSFPCLAELEERSPSFFEAALELRADGPWIDGGENDHAIAQTLLHVKEAIGIFGFSHLDETPGILPLPFEGVVPSRQKIDEGSYPVTRPLFLYTDLDRLQAKSSLAKTAAQFGDPAAIGPNGKLTKMGLVAGARSGAVAVIDTATGGRSAVERETLLPLGTTPPGMVSIMFKGGGKSGDEGDKPAKGY